MDDVFHVLPGDSVAEEFSKTGLEGEVIVCREALVEGDLSGDTIAEFWQNRAHFLMLAHGADEIDYHETVAAELSKIADIPDDAEVNLWFEYELFCSVNMWFCLNLLADSKASIYRVEPSILDREKLWDGFGSMDADELVQCFETRTKFETSDVQLGRDLWQAFRDRDSDRLLLLGESETRVFPYLKEVCEAAGKIETRPKEIIDDIVSTGKKGIAEIFPEFKKRAGVYGFGDTQVECLIRAEW